MMTHLSTLLLAGIVIVVLLCTTVLAITNSPIPSWFESVAAVAIGGAAGVAYQGKTP